MAVLQDLTKLTHEQLQAMVLAHQAANKPKALTLKVSEKGAVSLYGMGKWPVTLYASQWDRVIENIDQVRAFVEANRAILSVKA